MIIRVSGADPETARSSLGELARSWGHELTPVSTGTPTPPDLDHDGDAKAVDPLSLAALVLSIPSATGRAAGRDRGHRQGPTS